MAEEIMEAVQIIRVAYEGIEIAIRIGSGGLNAAQRVVETLIGLFEYEKTMGKTNMKNLLMKAKPVKEVRDYEVEVKETLSRLENIHAESLEDAINKVTDKYYAQEIILDAEDFVGVDFLPSEEEKNRTKKNLRSR